MTLFRKLALPGLLITALLLPATGFAEDSSCTDFRWVTDYDGSEKAAMVVTATINNHRIDLQFDTGSDVSLLYGEEQAAKLGLDVHYHDSGKQTARTAFKSGDIELTGQTFHIAPYPPADVAGRIGMKSLLGRIVQIDYPQQRICLLNTLEYLMMKEDLQKVPAQIRASRLFLTTTINGQSEQGLFFDTGSSLYSLLVDRGKWRQLTGQTGNEPANTRIQGWANDQLVTTIGAPLKGQAQLGEITVSAPLVHYIQEHPNYFAERPIPAVGLLGNALFFKHTVILDLRRKYTWFGILRREM